MPCRCDYEDLPSTTKNRVVYEDKYKRMCADLKSKADQATQLLCYLCGVVREHPELVASLDIRLKNWLVDHDSFDKKRTFEVLKGKYGGEPLGVLKNPNFIETARKNFIGEAEKVHPLSKWHRTVYFDKLWNQLIDTKTEEITTEIQKLEKQLEELKAIVSEEKR